MLLLSLSIVGIKKCISAGLALGTPMTAQYLRCQRTLLPNEAKIPDRFQTGNLAARSSKEKSVLCSPCWWMKEKPKCRALTQVKCSRLGALGKHHSSQRMAVGYRNLLGWKSFFLSSGKPMQASYTHWTLGELACGKVDTSGRRAAVL